MADKKRPLGFETPSMRIQEEYQEIREQITKKKTNWERIFTRLEKTFNVASDNLSNTFRIVETRTEETPKELLLSDIMKLNHGHLVLGLSLTQMMITGVGQELAECEARIAAVEKELKDLRKGLK